MDTNTELLIYLCLFMIKHYLSDKTWQTKYMGGKRRINLTWIIPLTAHVMVHISTSLLILLIMGRIDVWWILIVEFITHFTMDRIKSAPYLLGKFKQTKWQPYCTVFDQSIHGLTYIYMIWILIWQS